MAKKCKDCMNCKPKDRKNGDCFISSDEAGHINVELNGVICHDFKERIFKEFIMCSAIHFDNGSIKHPHQPINSPTKLI